MLQVLRRVGIAIGSIVAAWLVIALVGGAVLPYLGVPYSSTDPGKTFDGRWIVGLAVVVLGGLIYRDIIRRERRTS